MTPNKAMLKENSKRTIEEQNKYRKKIEKKRRIKKSEVLKEMS